MLDPISLLGSRVIAYRPVIRSCGIATLLSGTILASQLLYRYERAGRQEFHATDAELGDETGMTVNEVRRARADLVKRLGAESFFTYEVRGFKREAFWGVREERFASLMRESLPDPSVDALSGDRPNATGRTHECNRANARIHLCERPNDLYVRDIQEIEEEPLTPQSGERPSRDDGTNPRALGTNPRATGQNPRALGTNPRADSLAKQPEAGAQSDSTTHAATMTATAGTAPAQAPPRSKGRQASRDPLNSKELPRAAVPEDLAHLAEILTDWWAVKGKGRTTRAFELACRHLRRYGQADQEAILETAVMSGHQGLYPPKGSGNGRGAAPQQHPFLPPLYGARPTRGEVAAANVLQMMAESDRKKAEFRARMEAGMASANVPEDQP
jgi:hypothetical protein